MFAAPAVAQELTLGPKGGLSLGNLTSELGGDSSYRPGFAVTFRASAELDILRYVDDSGSDD